ncbi:MAG: tRNA (guanosine(46)-N7)-methyltransferase TrmB [bacterium]
MVRERVKNRDFHDHYIIPVPAEKEFLPLTRLYPASRPLEVDIGCGRGRFLLARAQLQPNRNFLGIDRCLLRLRKIDRKAVALGFLNIRLVQDDALRILPQLPAESVVVFYVFFPDPWPKRRHHSRRLVSPLFMDLIFRALAPDGVIHICTDHDDYYSAILHHWRPDARFRECEPFIPTEAEETDFSLIFRAQGKTANRCSFQKTNTVDATGTVI